MISEQQLQAEHIALGLGAATRDDVLREIAALTCGVSQSHRLDEQAVYGALVAREEVASTGLERGVAIPHARLPGLSDFVLGVITVPQGIDFHAADGQPTRLVVFMLAPIDRPGEHLRILSTISRILDTPGASEALQRASSPEQLRELFLRSAPSSRSGDAADSRSVIVVSVQHEEIFEDLLEVLASENASLTVSEARDVSHYLRAVPLYASLWQDEDLRFHRVISAVVNWRRVDEIVEELQAVLRREGVDDGVLITAQILNYAFGSLRP